MGYTSYWDTRKCTEADHAGFQSALPIIRDLVKQHEAILCYEHDVPDKPPLISPAEIQFNGRGKAGYETFLFQLEPEWAFCKTDRRPYDLPVCECLLVLKAYMPKLSISSDGFCGCLADQKPKVRLDESWDQAIENVRQYGVHFHAKITRRREPYCNMGLVLDRVESPQPIGVQR